MRALFRVLPYKRLGEVMRISDTITRRSQEIIDEKKAALAKGDAGLAHEVGEGKDIMSICRTCAHALCEVHPADQRRGVAQCGQTWPRQTTRR